VGSLLSVLKTEKGKREFDALAERQRTDNKENLTLKENEAYATLAPRTFVPRPPSANGDDDALTTATVGNAKAFAELLASDSRFQQAATAAAATITTIVADLCMYEDRCRSNPKFRNCPHSRRRRRRPRKTTFLRAILHFLPQRLFSSAASLSALASSFLSRHFLLPYDFSEEKLMRRSLRSKRGRLDELLFEERSAVS